MSQEFQSAASGAATGAQFGVPGAIIGGIVGLFAGGSARRKRRRVEKEGNLLKATEIRQSAYEMGRVARHRAGVERSTYAGAGLSTRSGSAQAIEREIMKESIYQQEAIVAGLPKGRNSQRGMFEAYNPRAGLSRGLIEPPPEETGGFWNRGRRNS